MYSVKSDRRYPKEELHDFTAVRFLFKLPLQLERKQYVLSWVIAVQTMLDKGFPFFFFMGPVMPLDLRCEASF